MKSHFAIVTAIAGFAMLSACGSGSSGSRSTLTQSGRFTSTQIENAIAQSGEAANAIPLYGSVTQSSRTGEGTGITLDQVDVVVGLGGDGRNMYTVTNDPPSGDGRAWTISTANGNPEDIDLDDGGASSNAFSGQALQRELSDGTLFVDVYSNIGPSTGTDYLAGGWWLFAPNSAANDYVIGAFADAGDPFDDARIAALTGTASYEGTAVGVYSLESDNTEELGRLDADVNLLADFTMETIAGEVTDIYIELEDGSPEPITGTTLTLGQATIGAANNGFFEGGLTGTDEDDNNFAGRWGGHFAGNDESHGYPGSVVGTFGGTGGSGDDSVTFVGAFGAAYEDPSP